MSVTDGDGLIFRSDDDAALSCLRSAIGEADLIVLHNIFHDLEVLRAMGIHLPVSSCVDTMIMAYLLVVEPQGLKPLGYRHAGMTMLSYDEVTAGASERVARDYLLRLWQTMPNWLKYRPSKSKDKPIRARRGETTDGLCR